MELYKISCEILYLGILLWNNELFREYGEGGGEMDIVEICEAGSIPCERC